MGCIKTLLVFVLPPLAVIDKGLFAFLVTLFLTACGWIPGILAAIHFNNQRTCNR